jgi:hypothetical protein
MVCLIPNNKGFSSYNIDDMNEYANIPANDVSFKDYLFKNKRNKTILSIGALAIVIQFSIFKYFYPQAGFISDDSYVYLRSAMDNLSINFYLVGYSKFLRLFSVFSTSDTILVAFQYLSIQASALFCLFTFFYFYGTGKTIQLILTIFMVLNPLSLYLANYVSSDGIFLALSFTWFASLVWILNRATNKIIIFHIVILFIAFTVRYNALIYPVISCFTFLLYLKPLRKKVGSIIACVITCGIFILYTGNKYQELTGTWQYAPFSGWQLANNALYAYRHVEPNRRVPVPEKFQKLDGMVRTHFDSTWNFSKYLTEGLLASTFYMWKRELPLFKYRELQFKRDSMSSDLKKWASMGPIYKEYGAFLIKQYPIYFLKFYIWPNANKYYAPPVEYLGQYNTSSDSVGPEAQYWFGYKSRKTHIRVKDRSVNTLNFYPVFTGVANMIFIASIICFFMLNGFRKKTTQRQVIIIGFILWLINAGFTIFASSVALRFQSFPIIITFVFTLLLIDWILQLLTESELKQKNAVSFQNTSFQVKPLS